MKNLGLPAIIAVLLLSILASTESAVATDANTYPAAMPFLSMPKEYVNYTIALVEGILYARIDGTYPICILRDSSLAPLESLSLVYPTPPGSTNIHIELNGSELEWGNYTQTYATALHHTALGDWPMINCTINPVPDSFMLRISYEHPLATLNGSYLCLYDLNIEPYLSPRSPKSTAFFNIRSDLEILNLKTYTTETDAVWNPINCTMSYEGTAQVFSVQIQSQYSKPLAGDLVVTFYAEGPTESPSLTILASLTATASVVAAGLLLHFRKRQRAAVIP